MEPEHTAVAGEKYIGSVIRVMRRSSEKEQPAGNHGHERNEMLQAEFWLRNMQTVTSYRES